MGDTNYIKKNKHEVTSNISSKLRGVFYFVIIIILINSAFLLFLHINYKNNSTPSDNSILSYLHRFENNNNLASQDLSINIENGITKIKGTIINTSNNTLKQLHCNYALLDNSNNIVYEFEISILKLEANSVSSFSSVCLVDLSNVVNYTVIEKK